MHSYISIFKHYFDFQGRTRRKDFWLFFLIHFSIIFFLGTAGGLFNETFSIEIESSLPMEILLIYVFVTVIPTLGVMVRRLHDQNRNRFFVLLPLIPFIGTLALIFLMCLPGQFGSNKYGPDPKNPNNEIDTTGGAS